MPCKKSSARESNAFGVLIVSGTSRTSVLGTGSPAREASRSIAWSQRLNGRNDRWEISTIPLMASPEHQVGCEREQPQGLSYFSPVVVINWSKSGTRRRLGEFLSPQWPCLKGTSLYRLDFLKNQFGNHAVGTRTGMTALSIKEVDVRVSVLKGR